MPGIAGWYSVAPGCLKPDGSTAPARIAARIAACGGMTGYGIACWWIVGTCGLLWIVIPCGCRFAPYAAFGIVVPTLWGTKLPP
jgi:hypothetical protein